jgi:DNA-damage-inducible protein D
MTENLLAVVAAPFDAIRNVTLEGREFWSARDLMPILKYDRWENFAAALDRAMSAADNQGHRVDDLFRGVTKKGDGRPQQDFELSRFAAYLVAMNGDPRKPAVAAAQAYFAIKTREAETADSASPQPAIMPTHADALRGWAEQLDRAERAESLARELTPAATSWNELAEATGDYRVSDAAKVLSRDPNITTGERRLYQAMSGLRWVFKRDGRWRAYQAQVELGRLTEKVGKPYVRNGEMMAGDATVRITPKGLAELHRRLGGSGQLALVALS